ncbi:MAG TPA: peptidylprolyl isomerase, partial [Candidatus Limnocylindrales bacterium]|nr:peptidylprolyl isomerase [Candidatus Limnocylindrales bacterium]
VIPFPIAKAGPHFVSYESYLFELRHLMHYYQTQQKENFNDPKTAGHLVQLKRDSLQKVIDDAYVKQLAAKHNISVSNREVNDQITLVKSQNRLGTNDQMLGDVLQQFWNWSINDFKRELKSQLLAQKVASELDVATQARAANALAALGEGKDFAKVAAEVSDDASTKANGGQYGLPISRSNRDVSPQVVDALFKLQPGQTSGVINTGYTLEIVKLIQMNGDKAQAAHISFNLKNIQEYIKPLKEENKPRRLIRV